MSKPRENVPAGVPGKTRRSPIRKRRPGLRKGELTPAEKEAERKVIMAAEMMPERDFRAKVRADHPTLHIEGKRRLFGKFEDSKASIIEEALDIVAELAQKGGTELDTLEDRLWYWAVDFVREHSGERVQG